MSEKKISYINRTFEDYRAALLENVKKYYPDITTRLDDASIGAWLVDMVASVADNLSYHTDRVYNETNINSAAERSSLLSIARTNGLKVPGPKASIAEEKFTCYLPVVTTIDNDKNEVPVPNTAYAPVIKRGTLLTTGSQFFELLEDVDFKEQFNSDGASNRNIFISDDKKHYRVEKYAAVYAGQTKVYKQVITNSDVRPFMEIIIPESDVMEITSIIFKDGTDYSSDPSMEEFCNPNEFVPAKQSPSGVDTYRFFEVDSLVEQYRWGDDVSTTKAGNQAVGHPVSYTYGYYDVKKDATYPVASVTKGEWVPLTQKFITEFTDSGYLKVIFGSGEPFGQTVDYSNAQDFTKAQISKMVRNNFLGKLPKAGTTMYIAYRTGGGQSSNVAQGKINQFAFLNVEIGKCISSKKDADIVASVKNTLTCTNTTPSVCGKNMPTVDELKNLIKYNSGALKRCVTLKDYENRILMMPSRYGSPFRVKAIEENNKVMVYMLGIDAYGKLSSVIPTQLVVNIENYLSMYRSMNDFVEMKSGRIINLSFEVDLYVDKNYNSGDVMRKVIEKITDYMDINKHDLGEDLYVSDISKEITAVDGVLNLIELRVYNEYGEGYSSTRCSQETFNDNEELGRAQIDLTASDFSLVSDADEMFEIKSPEIDIRIRVKQR